MFQLLILGRCCRKDHLQSRYHQAQHFERDFFLELRYQLAPPFLFDFFILLQHCQLCRIVLLILQIHRLWLVFQSQLSMQFELEVVHMDVLFFCVRYLHPGYQ